MKQPSETATTRPASFENGRALKEVLRRHRPDAEWATELRELRETVGPAQIGAAAAIGTARANCPR